MGGRLAGGYGRVMLARKGKLTHRIAYILTHGEPQNDVLHHCDNPPCVNPAHLYDGTDKDNARDRVVRDRIPFHGGELCPVSKLTAIQVEQIRALNLSHRKIGEMFGVSPTTIGRVKRRECYK